MDLAIRLASDGGAPIVTSQPDSAQAAAFHSVAKALVGQELPNVAHVTHETPEALSLPPLMYGEAASESAVGHAVARARGGCDAGLLSYRLMPDRIEAALVFAPEVPLGDAMIMLPLAGWRFRNALGGEAPPEVAVHLEWAGAIRVNGARCGRLCAVASGPEPSTVPDWLVIGLSVALWPVDDAAPGDTPDQTTLYAEGCANISAPDLLEAWARHTLNWLGHWEDTGAKSLHETWRALAHGIGD